MFCTQAVPAFAQNQDEMVNYAASISTREMEPNDSYTDANIIEANTAICGSLTTPDDIDWYKAQVSEQGYVSLSLSHEYIESGRVYWIAYLYDANFNELVNHSLVGSKTSEQGVNIGVAEGTYYIKITTGLWRTDAGMGYNMKLNFTADSGWETELNDSYSDADTIDAKAAVYKYTGNKATVQEERISVPAGTYYLKIVSPAEWKHSDVDYNFNLNYISESEWFLYGDADENETIDAADALIILKVAAKMQEIDDAKKIVVDVDGNGVVDSADALQVLKKAAKLIEKFPVEE